MLHADRYAPAAGNSTADGGGEESLDYNYTYYDYGSVRPQLPMNMELNREYILDYTEYRRVLEKCNTSLHTDHYPEDGGLYCNATWDLMQCWGYTKANTTVYQPCPAYVTLSNPLAFSKKTCNPDGGWFRHPDSGNVWTNYSMCYDHSLMESHKRVLYMYYIGFGVSIVLLITSLIIFNLFRQLKCARVTLHKHLFTSYVLTGALWIMYYALVPTDPAVLLMNPLWCQVVHVLTHYFTLCNYAWMFCEGFYLHALMVIAFTKDKKLLFICYFIGWVFPIVPTIIYTSIRAVDPEENDRCWTGDSNLYWILAGPINASLIINFIFSVNIMRILLSKLRSVHTNETMQTRRAVRATLILIPLLGLQFIAFPFKPPPGSDGEYIYSMISAFLVSFQGVFVALVFCFFNGEVVKAVRKWWRRRKLQGAHRNRLSSRGSKRNSENDGMLRSMMSSRTDYDTKATTQTATTSLVHATNNNDNNHSHADS